MKCYTVTEKGIAAGIRFEQGSYPYVGIGDPNNQFHFRRVEVDHALSDVARDNTIFSCSVALDMRDVDKRRSSYMLVEPSGEDDDQALVKMEANCANGGRTYYEFPRDTFVLANGWYTGPQGHIVKTQCNLAVLRKDALTDVYKDEDVWKKPERVFRLRFDGSELQMST